jgi:hypothetical protein
MTLDACATCRLLDLVTLVRCDRCRELDCEHHECGEKREAETTTPAKEESCG